MIGKSVRRSDHKVANSCSLQARSLDLDQMGQVHLLSFSSCVQKRVVNSTIKAGTYQRTDVVQAADLLRAAIAVAYGKLDHKDWETSGAHFMRSVWYTDCKSCYDTLQKPIAKTVNK